MNLIWMKLVGFRNISPDLVVVRLLNSALWCYLILRHTAASTKMCVKQCAHKLWQMGEKRKRDGTNCRMYDGIEFYLFHVNHMIFDIAKWFLFYCILRFVLGSFLWFRFVCIIFHIYFILAQSIWIMWKYTVEWLIFHCEYTPVPKFFP